MEVVEVVEDDFRGEQGDPVQCVSLVLLRTTNQFVLA